MLGGDLGCPRLDLMIGHLHRGATLAAHQVVVMVFEQRRYTDSPVSERNVSTCPADAIACSVR